MTTIDPEHDWTTCPRGALAQLDRRLCGKRRSALLRESAVLIVVATSIGLTAGYLASPGNRPSSPSAPIDFAGISCGDVRSLMPELIVGRLDEAQTARILRHVEQCPACGALMERIRASDRAADKTAPAGAGTMALAAYID